MIDLGAASEAPVYFLCICLTEVASISFSLFLCLCLYFAGPSCGTVSASTSFRYDFGMHFVEVGKQASKERLLIAHGNDTASLDD